MSNKVTIEQIQAALNTSNGDLNAACNILNMKYQALYARVRKYNLQYNSKKELKCSKEQMEEAYARLGSLSLVAKELGGTKEGIRIAMRRHGLEMKKLVIHTCNENFFAEDNEESFYWAGFVAADGCVKTRKNSHELTIALAQKDKEHLEKFQKAIKTTAPIHDYLVKNSRYNSEWNDTWKSEILITSKKIFEDLARFNIVPKKSLIYTFPDRLVNHSLVNHFLRGYFDGDGSFYTSLSKDRKIPQLYFSLRGTQEFLTICRFILERECNLEERNKDIRMNNGIGVLEYGGNGVVKQISQFVYTQANTFLNRKRIIVYG